MIGYEPHTQIIRLRRNADCATVISTVYGFSIIKPAIILDGSHDSSKNSTYFLIVIRAIFTIITVFFSMSGMFWVLLLGRGKKLCTTHEQTKPSMQASQIGVLSQKKGKFTSIRSLVRTLIDYVQMLDDLNVPKTIKPSMAVAFLKAFYGTALTDILFLPLSHKLEGKSQEEVTVNCIHIMALASIGINKTQVGLEMLLNSITPPPQKVWYFD
jgi:hypothetical protein